MRMCCQLVVEFSPADEGSTLGYRAYVVDRDGNPCQLYPEGTVQPGHVLTFGPCYVECESSARLASGDRSSQESGPLSSTRPEPRPQPKQPQPQPKQPEPKPQPQPKQPEPKQRGGGPDMPDEEPQQQSAAEEALFGKSGRKGGDPRK